MSKNFVKLNVWLNIHGNNNIFQYYNSMNNMNSNNHKKMKKQIF